MPSVSDRCQQFGSKSVLRLLALSLALAVASPVLLADDGDHDQDHRDHGKSVDPIVGSWIVHVTIDTLDPNPDHVPLPIKVDDVANLGADGNTADFDPPSTSLYGPWVKVGDRIYRQKIVTVNNDNHTMTTAFTGPLVLNQQGDQIFGPMHTIVTDPSGKVVVQWSGTLLFDRIKFSLAP